MKLMTLLDYKPQLHANHLKPHEAAWRTVDALDADAEAARREALELLWQRRERSAGNALAYALEIEVLAATIRGGV